MSLYVIETDAPCKNCYPDGHGYVTQMCALSVFVDFASAKWVSNAIEGSMVREIREVPEGVNYMMYLHKNGRPDRAYPRTVADVSSS